MRLRKMYEEHFGFRYSDLNEKPFAPHQGYASRDHQYRGGQTVINLGTKLGLFPSASEARRIIKSGGVRVGRADMNTHASDCGKISHDQPVMPNDLIRVGRKGLWMRPPEPTFREELHYLLKRAFEAIA